MTDDMSPDEKRRARISNIKAKSAYKKALNAAGVSATTVAAPAPQSEAAAPPAAVAATPEPATAMEPVAASSEALVAIPRPEFIELTDDMAPDEIRRARISNVRAKAAYKKALNAAGIDPSSVDV